MGAIILLTPVVIAAWPTFATAILSAATSLGYVQAGELDEKKRQSVKPSSISLEVPNSEVVTDQLGRDQKMIVTRDGVTIAFRRDARGKASLEVSGNGLSHEKLKEIGEEMSRRVVQQYVYQQIMAEVDSRNYTVVEESVDANNAIRMTVRHWEN